MAHLFKNLALVCGLFITISCSSSAQGRNITIFLTNGSQMYGELLAVHDSVITISKLAIEKDEEIAANPEIVKIALLKDIDRVRLEEYNVSGFLTGMLIGGGVGLVYGLTTDKDAANNYSGGSSTTKDNTGNAIAGVLGGALSGAVTQRFIGWLMSKAPETVFPSVVNGLMAIRPDARFDDNVPPFVRDIIMERLRESK